MESGSTSTYDTENGVGYEIYLCTNVSGVALLLRDWHNLTGCAAIFKIGLPSHTRPFNCQCFGGGNCMLRCLYDILALANNCTAYLHRFVYWVITWMHKVHAFNADLLQVYFEDKSYNLIYCCADYGYWVHLLI